MTRWFGTDCEIVGHEAGDRHWDIGTCDSEWTGQAWTRVCDRCDAPMSGRDSGGYLCCGTCGRLFDEVPRREVAP